MFQQTKYVQGNIARNGDNITLLVEGLSSAAIQLTGTFNATVDFEYSLDNANWNTLKVVNVSSGASVSSVTAVGVFVADVSGFLYIRAKCSAYTSGTIQVYIRAIASGIGAGGSTSKNTSSTANTPSIQTGATALAANASRKGFLIQNVGTNPLFVRFGDSASTTVFHVVLKGGTGDSDGLGASYEQMSGIVYSGLITIAGTSPKYVVTEL